MALFFRQRDIGGDTHFLEDLTENERAEIAGDDENVLTVFDIGGNAAGDLFVAVGGNVDKNCFCAADGLGRIGGDLGRGADAVNLAAQLDKADFLDGVQGVAESFIVVQCDLKAAHGHNACNGMAGGTGADYRNFLDHDMTPLFLVVRRVVCCPRSDRPELRNPSLSFSMTIISCLPGYYKSEIMLRDSRKSKRLPIR